MKHFYNSIEEYLTDDNISMLDTVIKEAHDNFVWVELGSWTGKSVAYCVVELINKPVKNFKFYSIDTWEWPYKPDAVKKEHDIELYDIFLENIKPIKEHVILIRKRTFDAAEMFNDNSVDFCYVDADHSYEGIMKDLKAWWPKIKPGCWMAGDDYNEIFPGVPRAVNEFFREKNITFTVNKGCWMVRK